MAYDKPKVTIDLEEYQELQKIKENTEGVNSDLIQKVQRAIAYTLAPPMQATLINQRGTPLERFQEAFAHEGLEIVVTDNHFMNSNARVNVYIKAKEPQFPADRVG